MDAQTPDSASVADLGPPYPATSPLSSCRRLTLTGGSPPILAAAAAHSSPDPNAVETVLYQDGSLASCQVVVQWTQTSPTRDWEI
uniref:Uncharacterized protein n=1 Tax=Oryza barthii TaxID=65489 RepID=A0A0D3FBF7_9ORYZ